MAYRTRRRKDVEQALSLRKAEGLSFRELSERTGIPAGTLSSWHYKLEREARDGGTGFVQLLEADTDGSRERPTAVRIKHPSGTVIEFSGEAADTVTERLLLELMSW